MNNVVVKLFNRKAQGETVWCKSWRENLFKLYESIQRHKKGYGWYRSHLRGDDDYDNRIECWKELYGDAETLDVGYHTNMFDQDKEPDPVCEAFILLNYRELLMELDEIVGLLEKEFNSIPPQYEDLEVSYDSIRGVFLTNREFFHSGVSELLEKKRES